MPNYSPALLYGKAEDKILVDKAMGVPDLKATLDDVAKLKPHIAIVDSEIWVWKVDTQEWVLYVPFVSFSTDHELAAGDNVVEQLQDGDIITLMLFKSFGGDIDIKIGTTDGGDEIVRAEDGIFPADVWVPINVQYVTPVTFYIQTKNTYMKKLLFLLLLLPFLGIAQVHTLVRAKKLEADSSITLRRIQIDSIRLGIDGWLGDIRSTATVDAIAKFVSDKTGIDTIYYSSGNGADTLKYVKNGIENIFYITNPGCQNKTLSIYSIVYTGTDFDFFVSDGSYQIDCQQYTNVSGVHSLDPADPSNDRTDVIYLDATGVHVLTGVVAPPGTSVKPLVQGDQIELTSILVKAGTTGPVITEQIVYDENTESVVTHIGTTINADYLINPYNLTKSVLVGTLTLNDYIIFTKVSGSWDLTGYNAMTGFIRFGSVMPNLGTFRVALYNGVQQVSNEVVLAVDKNNTTGYQGFSISSGTFGNLLNQFVTSVRFRYTTSTTDAFAPQFDFIKFVSGGPIISVPSSLTASEGVTKVTEDIRWLGDLPTPAQIFTERSVNLHHKSLHFNNAENQITSGGPIWQHSDRPFSPYQFFSTDTLATDGVTPPTAAMPVSGLFARRTMYYNSGIRRTQKIYGHYLGMTYDWLDSMRFDTQGGDYNQATIAELRLKPRGTGAQRTGIHGTGSNNLPYYSVSALVGNIILTNSGGLSDGSTSTVHTYGWLNPVKAYLVTGALDTVERASFFQTGNFLQGKTGKLYGLDFQHNLEGGGVDSSYGLWDQYGYRHWLRGKIVFGTNAGTNTWVSSDQVKIIGNLNVTDSVHLGKASLIGDSTGMDFVLRRRTDGALFRIRADLTTFLGGGGTGGIDDVLAVGQVLTTDRSSDGGAFTWLHTAAPTTSYSFNVYNTAAAASGGAIGALATGTTSEGVFSQSLKYYGLRGKTFNSSITAAGRFEKDNSTQNSVEPVVDIVRMVEAAGTGGTNGIGGAIDWYTENDNPGEVPKSNRLIAKYTDVTNGSEDSEFEFWGLVNGVMTQFGSIGSGGIGGEATTIGAFQTTGTADGLSLSGTDIRLHRATTSLPGGIIVGSGFGITAGGVLSGLASARENGNISSTQGSNHTIDFIGSGITIGTNGAGEVTVDLSSLGGGGISLAAAGSGTPNANAATLTGSVLNLEVADASNFGVVKPSTGLSTSSGVLTTAQRGRLNTGGVTTSGGPRINFIGTGITLSNATGDLDVDFSALVPTAGTTWSGVFGGSTLASGDATIPNSASVQWVSQNTAPATFTLPDLATNGNEAIFVKNEGTNNLTVQRAGSDQIWTTSATTSITITPGQSLLVMSSGSFWHVHNIPVAAPLTQEQVEDYVGALFGTDNGDIDFNYNDGTPDIGAQIKAGAIVNADVNGSAAIDIAKIAFNGDFVPDGNNTRDVGSTANSVKDIYTRTVKYDGSTSGTVTVSSDATGITTQGINTTGTGYGQFWHKATEASDFTGQNINTVQPVFSTGHDVITVQGSTEYEFEMLVMLSHGATSHSVGFSFELGGGCTLTSITYVTLHWATAIGTQTASQTTNVVQVATNVAANAALSNATEQFVIKGTIRVNAGGTITPSYTYSAAPGGTVLTKAGSFIKLSATGNNTYTEIGPFN